MVPGVRPLTESEPFATAVVVPSARAIVSADQLQVIVESWKHM